MENNPLAGTSLGALIDLIGGVFSGEAFGSTPQHAPPGDPVAISNAYSQAPYKTPRVPTQSTSDTVNRSTFRAVSDTRGTWTSQDSRVQAMDKYQRAALIATLEDNDPEGSKDVISAMVNRAQKGNQDLGAHVMGRIYEPNQARDHKAQARAQQYLNDPSKLQSLADYAKQREMGLVPDRVNGATHFIIPEKHMVKKWEEDPNVYRISSWGSWTGYNHSTGRYSPQYERHRNKAHVFGVAIGG